MNIPYFRPTIPFFKPSLRDAEIQAVFDVLRGGWLTTGPRAREFEEAFQDFLGPGVSAVAVNSATAGLHLALDACGIGPGDEVLVPTLTFTATAEVVRYVGADVVLVDVDPRTLGIDLQAAERAVTSRTRAILPVHFGGLACPMRAVWNFAAEHGLRVIEDAAHALPTRSEGLMIGSGLSDACVFSFYANKTITTGEGGMLVTRDGRIAERARIMRCHGLNRDAFDRFRRVGAAWAYDVIAPGFKYNLTDLAAALGIVQLGRVFDLQKGRQAAAERYLETLADLPLDLPAVPPEGDLHAWHLFPIRVREEARLGRDDLMAALSEQGIGSSVHYRPLHQMSYWKNNAVRGGQSFPVADRYYAGALSLPLFPDLSEADVDAVSSVLHDLLG